MHCLRKNPLRPASLPHMPTVFFDSEFLDSPEHFSKRFEDSRSVSLLYANELAVTGSVFFEQNVRIEGTVKIVVPPGKTYRVRSGAVLTDQTYP